MLSPTTLVRRGLGVEMSSRASLTAAMIADAITSVDAYRSAVLRSCSSCAIALRISPMAIPCFLHPSFIVTRQSTLEYFGGQVASTRTAQRAGLNDPAIGHCLNGCSDVLTATLAGDDKGVDLCWRALEHGRVTVENTRRIRLQDSSIMEDA